MDKFKQIKELVSPIDVALKIIGTPDKSTSNKLWYKNPIREERTASLAVDKVGFYDFGINKFYDVISFTSEYLGLKPLEAVDVLSSYFNIKLDDNTLSKEEIERIKAERKIKREHENKVKDFINNFEKFVITEIKDVTRNIKELDLYCNLCQKFMNEADTKEGKKIFMDNITESVEESFNLSTYRENLIYIDTIIDDLNFKQKERLFELNKSIRTENKGIDTKDFFKKIVELMKKDEAFEFDYEKIEELRKELDKKENFEKYVIKQGGSVKICSYNPQIGIEFKDLKESNIQDLPKDIDLLSVEDKVKAISCTLGVYEEQNTLSISFNVHSSSYKDFYMSPIHIFYKEIDINNFKDETSLFSFMSNELNKFEEENREDIKKYSEAIHLENQFKLEKNLGDEEGEEM